MRRIVGLVLSLAALGIAGGCDDVTGSGGSAATFASGECKKEAAAEGAIGPRFLYTPWDGDELLGLTCIAWAQAADGALGLDLLNFGGPCGAEWAGAATVGEDGLDLRVENPSCLLAACGSCIYDWSFEVAAVPAAGDLALTVTVDACPEDDSYEDDLYAATLPAGQRSEGILCRWGDVGDLDWMTSTCGQALMPCSADSQCAYGVDAPCLGDGVCADRGDGAEVCLPPCVSDADCPLDGLLFCADDGLCRLAATW